MPARKKRPPSEDLPVRAEDLICFTIYSAGHAFNRAYHPMLKELGLTYPQYIALTALWEKDGIKVGELGARLRLESSTLTPLLKRLEKLGHVQRKRGQSDERQVFIFLTKSGRELKKAAPEITRCIVEATGVELEKLDELVKSISDLRDNLLTVTDTL